MSGLNAWGIASIVAVVVALLALSRRYRNKLPPEEKAEENREMSIW